MKVIEVTHLYNLNSILQRMLAMAFGFFDGMHKGHDKVFDILNEIAEARSLKSGDDI